VQLGELFANVGATVPQDAAAVDVRALAVDSRRVTPGSLFAALPGVHEDGTKFAAQAVGRGAVAVLAGHGLEAGAPVVIADNPRTASRRGASRSSASPAPTERPPPPICSSSSPRRAGWARA
jgi:UDP-N-acetylmuramoyl-L-alanyl-D-glutamate--2,6-diaminopimelate ligase